MDKTIYLLPGRGGRLNQGLGEELLERDFDVFGRELHGEFQKLTFGKQIELVANDLKSRFWRKDARVIANSFGAYLFLHAQTLLPPYIGRVLLLSPIVGEASNEETMMFFVPPRANHLQELVRIGAYPTPERCEIHVGEDDWQSNPRNVSALATSLNIKVSVLPKTGHRLGQAYVSSLLDTWLPVN
jgi:hypothetical protein